ncbi:MAG: hypothetical protein JO136_03695 [Hyphomicrobiales bacterium]|nr:hypothetical protein [Hyphomicrobiales bacterium]
MGNVAAITANALDVIAIVTMHRVYPASRHETVTFVTSQTTESGMEATLLIAGITAQRDSGLTQIGLSNSSRRCR